MPTKEYEHRWFTIRLSKIIHEYLSKISFEDAEIKLAPEYWIDPVKDAVVVNFFVKKKEQ